MFTQYGRQHFNLDRLIDYQLEPIDGAIRPVNPTWRRLDGEIRSRAAKQARRKAKLHDLTLKGQLTPKRAEHSMEKAKELLVEIEQEAAELEVLKEQRREKPKHVTIDDLPEEDRFLKLGTRSKHFIDTLKIIAYRAETAMSRVVAEDLGKHHRDQARAFVRDLYTTEANLVPDREAGTLTVEVHSLATPKSNEILGKLCAELNATETIDPNTSRNRVFKSVSD